MKGGKLSYSEWLKHEKIKNGNDYARDGVAVGLMGSNVGLLAMLATATVGGPVVLAAMVVAQVGILMGMLTVNADKDKALKREYEEYLRS